MASKETIERLEDLRSSRIRFGIVVALVVAINALIGLLGVVHNYHSSSWASVAVILATMVIMVLRFGTDPRRWWRAFGGYEIILDPPTHVSTSERDAQIKDMKEWLANTLPATDYNIVNPWWYHFRKKDQLMMFKLVWYR